MGLTWCRNLRSAARKLPWVMFSGFPSPDRAAEAIKRGAMEFLTKPFTPEELTEVVRKAMDGKVRQEKKAISRAQQVLGKFPVPSLDDKGPGIIAETVAQTVGVAKANSPLALPVCSRRSGRGLYWIWGAFFHLCDI